MYVFLLQVSSLNPFFSKATLLNKYNVSNNNCEYNGLIILMFHFMEFHLYEFDNLSIGPYNIYERSIPLTATNACGDYYSRLFSQIN